MKRVVILVVLVLVIAAAWSDRSSWRSSRVSPCSSTRRSELPRFPILLASARSSGVSVAPSCRRYKVTLRLDEPVLIVSRRRPLTMFFTFPEANPGSQQDATGGSPVLVSPFTRDHPSSFVEIFGFDERFTENGYWLQKLQKTNKQPKEALCFGERPLCEFFLCSSDESSLLQATLKQQQNSTFVSSLRLI
jgi:hypothetical protein